jgi:hypothetical protein
MKKPNLATSTCGIASPNPFWLASAPPTNSGYQVMKAFEAAPRLSRARAEVSVRG